MGSRSPPSSRQLGIIVKSGLRDMLVMIRGPQSQDVEARTLLLHERAGDDKARNDAKPRDVLRLATIDGARSIGLGDEIGSITSGKRADLILIDLPPLGAVHFGSSPFLDEMEERMVEAGTA